jgi:hypothetical protein
LHRHGEIERVDHPGNHAFDRLADQTRRVRNNPNASQSFASLKGILNQDQTQLRKL